MPLIGVKIEIIFYLLLDNFYLTLIYMISILQ